MTEARETAERTAITPVMIEGVKKIRSAVSRGANPVGSALMNQDLMVMNFLVSIHVVHLAKSIITNQRGINRRPTGYSQQRNQRKEVFMNGMP